MVLARMILALIAIVAAVSGIWSWGVVSNDSESLMGVVAMLLVPVFLAAVTVLIFSFVEFKQKDGKFLVNKDNLFLKFVTGRSGQKSITMCSLFWSTVFAMIVVGGLLFIGIGYCYLLVTKFSWSLLTPILLLLSLVLLNWAGKGNKSAGIAWLVLIGLFFSFVSVVMPIMNIMAGGYVPFADALLIYFVMVLEFVGQLILFVGAVMIALVVALVVGILLFGLVKGSTVGKILASGWKSVKSRTCPIISAVSYKE